MTVADWTGELPPSWQLSTVGRMAKLRAGGTPTSTSDDFWDATAGTRWLSIADMDDVEATLDHRGRFLTPDGLFASRLEPSKRETVLFAMYASVGAVAYLRDSAVWNQAIVGLEAREHQAEARYIYWVMKALEPTLPFHYRSNTQHNLNAEQVRSFAIPQPPLTVQRAIADYLDRETAQIDEFIAKSEKLIRILTERRAATITFALKSGLDDSADSQGDPRLGKVPAHWGVMPMRYLLRRIEQGVSPQAESGLAGGQDQFGVLKAGCVNGGVYRPTEHKLLPAHFDIDRSLLVHPGDLLVNRASGSVQLLGSAAIVTASAYQLILSDKTFRLIPSALTSRDYLYWLLNSRLYREQVEASVSGADGLANNLSQSNLRRFVLTVPPRKEQERINSYLNERCAKIDMSIETAHRGIKVAQERRAALISAAVTGKIEVGVAA